MGSRLGYLGNRVGNLNIWEGRKEGEAVERGERNTVPDTMLGWKDLAPKEDWEKKQTRRKRGGRDNGKEIDWPGSKAAPTPL